MDSIKEWLKKENIRPRISFKDGKPHTVKILNAREDEITDNTGKVKKGIKLLVEEGGEMKTFFTSSVQLLSYLANLEENETVTLQMKSRKGSDGNFRSYFDIKRADTGEDIPIIGEPAEETDDFNWPDIKE
jgi:hypothetical protein